MNLKYIILFFLFFCKNLFCIEIQYFLSDFFYKNPHSYLMNGIKLINYYPGELLEDAFETKKGIYKKCQPEIKSDFIVNLYPVTVYDPFLKNLNTDIKVRLYSESAKKYNELKISHENRVYLQEYSEGLITQHYIELIDILSNEISKVTFPIKKINGDRCLNFN